MNAIDEIIEHTANSGGASINMATGKVPATGYMVSRAGSETVTDGLTREHLEQFTQAYQEELDKPWDVARPRHRLSVLGH